MKRTPLKRKSTLNKTSKRKPLGIYEPPKWFKRIKLTYSEHGNTTAQKRLWRVVTNTYRKEEWETYGENCPICGIHLPSWKDGQMLHWFRYSLCNNWLKWERKNMVFGCAGCNKKDDSITAWKIGEILKMRYGDDNLLWIEKENLRLQKQKTKIETWHIVDYVARMRPDLVQED